MKNKVVALFVACVVVLAAWQVQVSEAQEPQVDAAAVGGAKPPHKEGKFSKEYDMCMEECMKKCDKNGQEYTDCEVKCDEDCSKMTREAKVQNYETKAKEQEAEQAQKPAWK